MAAAQTRYGDDQMGLILPIGDGLGGDVAGLDLVGEFEGVGIEQLCDGANADGVEALGRLGADRGGGLDVV